MNKKERAQVAITARNFAKEWLKKHPKVSQSLQKKATANGK